MKNKAKILLVIILCSQIISSQTALAQFDDEEFVPPPPPGFDEGNNGDIDLPPPPPPPSSGAQFTPPRGGRPNSEKANVKSGNAITEKMANAGIEDINNANFPQEVESFDFPNAEITDLVKVISGLTGKNFIIDPGVRGKISIVAPSKITVAEAYKAFLSALAINGFAVIPSGKFFKIRSARNAQRDGIETYSGSYYPNADQMITRIIHLKHISAEMVNRDLRILTSKDGELSPYTSTNSLIVSDYGSNIERIMKIIGQLDVPGFEDQLDVLPIRFAKAKDMAELVNKIVNKDDKKGSSGSSFSAGVPRFSRSTGSGQGTSSAYFMVIPDDRTNSLIIVGNKAGIGRVRKLVGQLDFKIKPEEQGGVQVYYVKYGDAEKIAQTLQGIAKDASPKPSSSSSGGLGAPALVSTSQGVQAAQELFGGEVKITADKGTNSLVIVASKQDYDVIMGLLGKLDIPRDQVFVEAIIMEMKLTDALNWNIGYFQYDSSGSGAKAGFNGFSGTSLADLLSPQGGTGAILGFGSKDTVKIKPVTGGSEVTLPSLVGFINFLKTNTNANVLSTPQVLALDNQEAVIEVGDKVVTGTSSTTANGATVETPVFEEATIKLQIKPTISPSSNTVRMELQQSVKQPSTAKSPEGLAKKVQPLATRSIKTNIVVPNGDTAVLGGLMKEDENEVVSKVPLLGDIPVIGWLFKSRTISKEKTNMLVFLTPKIIRNTEDAKHILSKKLDDRLDFVKSVGGRDPYGYKLDELSGKKSSRRIKAREAVESSNPEENEIPDNDNGDKSGDDEVQIE